MIIRDEMVNDGSAIRSVVAAAFKDMPFSRQTETAIVEALRRTGAMTISLVACDEDAVIGHIAFSPVQIDGRDQGWFGLGPVAVRPDKQRRGVGASLIREGLRRLEMCGAKGCVVLGDPAYYRRFGFRTSPDLHLANVPPDHFMALPFGKGMPSGEARYTAAFDAA